MGLPLSYVEFAKDPIKGLLFVVILAVGYLYYDNKTNYQDQVEKCYQSTQSLEGKVQVLTRRVAKSDSALAVATTKLKVLAQLNQIQEI